MAVVRVIGFIAAVALACTRLAQAQNDAAPAPCGVETLGIFAAGPAVDGRTFRLKDGREVRLAGVEVPPGSAAQEALEKFLGGGLVALKRQEPGSDRYGHLVAHVFALRDGSERWIQREMIAGGHARVGAHGSDPSCIAALLTAERKARDGHIGLWGDATYAIKQADDLAGLLAEKGRFTVAEGRVLSVRESGSTIYINFGRVWSRNLTVTILRRNVRAFAAAGIDPKKLEARRIRVRGWIEDRNGPMIEVTRPEQIEIVGGD